MCVRTLYLTAYYNQSNTILENIISINLGHKSEFLFLGPAMTPEIISKEMKRKWGIKS